MYGNISDRGDFGGERRKSYLFFLTAFYPGIGLTGDRVIQLGKQLMFELSAASPTDRENPR
jgi:hypothetical protein